VEDNLKIFSKPLDLKWEKFRDQMKFRGDFFASHFNQVMLANESRILMICGSMTRSLRPCIVSKMFSSLNIERNR
jgi:hypothetical protein